MKSRISMLMAFASMLLFSHAAVSVTIHRDFSGNDCAGYFALENGFDSCTIFINVDDEPIQLSPVIAKYDIEESTFHVNEAFSTVTEDDFVITSTSTGTGNWTYNRDSDDPGVRFWVAKGGNSGFTLFWEVDDMAANGVCDVLDPYTLACLQAALVVTEGDYDTPLNSSNNTHPALSHITFYDSIDPYVVPVPASVWLMGSGLAGLMAVARRRRK